MVCTPYVDKHIYRHSSSCMPQNKKNAGNGVLFEDYSCHWKYSHRL